MVEKGENKGGEYFRSILRNLDNGNLDHFYWQPDASFLLFPSSPPPRSSSTPPMLVLSTGGHALRSDCPAAGGVGELVRKPMGRGGDII